MFSLVWEVRNDSTSLAEIVKKNELVGINEGGQWSPQGHWTDLL